MAFSEIGKAASLAGRMGTASSLVRGRGNYSDRPASFCPSISAHHHAHRFLGEFGGPAIGKPGDAGWNRTRVDQTVSLTLSDLPAHAGLKVSFDLLILKSWDGNSPAYGPDRWSLAVTG